MRESTSDRILSFIDRGIDIVDKTINRIFDIYEHVVHTHFDKLIVCTLFCFLVFVVFLLVYSMGTVSENTVQWARELTVGLVSLLGGLVTGVAYGRATAKKETEEIK